MIVIVDYGMGNLGSIANMFRRIGVEAERSRDPKVIARAERLVLPGVGAFDNGMNKLRDLGVSEVLTERVLADRIPVLGICLGMQLMTASSEEGEAAGLGWIDAATVALKKDTPAEAARQRVPHIGWNFIDLAKPHPVLDALPDDPRYYFVHSFKVVCADTSDVLCRTDYGAIEVTAGFSRGNIAGVQFHPEKSHRFGMKLLSNFAAWTP